ncbi:hypothetical protein H2201_005134 [Coniosporium apollinis]|uniref:ADF-H domain-containing protein n=1 Tax=Coniosporium apollinis TaxID=61459 RepID=A0ABQ9NQQ5_9PEZI|nr:hypothetical protein H2201_005134 [Coniosporium apollinis]
MALAAKARVLAEKKAAAERALRELGGEEWVFAVDAATDEEVFVQVKDLRSEFKVLAIAARVPGQPSQFLLLPLVERPQAGDEQAEIVEQQ